ncbi:MAG: hypothetical protein ACHQ50_13710 [Fimbriimonadales bacterium]
MHGRIRTGLPAKGSSVEVEVTVGPARDVPLLAANQILVNFTGSEFLVSVLAAYPEPFTGVGSTPVPKKVEAKVLSRYAFGLAQWVTTVRSFEDQLKRMDDEGLLHVEMELQEERKPE